MISQNKSQNTPNDTSRVVTFFRMHLAALESYFEPLSPDITEVFRCQLFPCI